jgi:SM-20-related protein
MGLLYLDALRNATVTTTPFTFTVVPGFVQPEQAAAIRRDFPDIPYPGLLPVEATQAGPRFAELIAELQSLEVAAVFSEKFGIDLIGRPTMITVRGRCQERDGRIHTDSESKW